MGPSPAAVSPGSAGFAGAPVGACQAVSRELAVGGAFMLVIGLLVLLAVLFIDLLSAARAYIGGESLWSKGQKGALPMVGDRRKVYQVLLNLAHNAVKFTERGEVRLQAQALGEEMRITVADTGVGIPSDQLSLLFEAFRQLDGRLNRAHEGTGLGLYFSRRLVGLMDGTIGVESLAGQGSVFTVTLPSRLPEPPADQARRASAAASPV